MLLIDVNLILNLAHLLLLISSSKDHSKQQDKCKLWQMKDVFNLATKAGQRVLEVSQSVEDKKEKEVRKKEAGRYN